MNSDERTQNKTEKPLEISASLESPGDSQEENVSEKVATKEELMTENSVSLPTQEEEDLKATQAESVEENLVEETIPIEKEEDLEATQVESVEESPEENLEESSTSVEATAGDAEVENENSQMSGEGDIASATLRDREEPVAEDDATSSEPEVPLEEQATELEATVANLRRQEQDLRRQVASLQVAKTKMQQELVMQTQALSRLLPEALEELGRRKQGLLVEVEKLERRKERIDREMRTTFAGVSQDLAIRVQGFKDYLVGSLQDLAIAAEQLDIAPTEYKSPDFVGEEVSPEMGGRAIAPKFAEQGFKDEVKQVRRLLDQYRTMPDYYGPAWQLRRTFEPIHAERVSEWFFTQGGRGALRSMGSRLQNILIASAAVSVLNALYGEQMQVLVLANSPERLGEWRRGLQDCLGIDRRDFGPDRGVVLFEDAELLAQKAERLQKKGGLPMIIIDDTEDRISMSMLQFPLWLAFAPEPQPRDMADRW